MQELPLETDKNMDNSGDQHNVKNVPTALLGAAVNVQFVPS